jgi:hypothetical protein
MRDNRTRVAQTHLRINVEQIFLANIDISEARDVNVLY